MPQAAQRAVLLGEPARRQGAPPVEQRVAPATGVAEVDPRLAVVLLAGRPAPLAGDPGRVPPLLGDVAAVDEPHAVLLAQRLVHQLAVGRQHPVIVPGGLADTVLERAHPPLRRGAGPQQTQRDGCDVLAGDIGGQQAAQVARHPGGLVAPGEAGREVGLLGGQLLGQARHIGSGAGAGDGHLVAQIGHQRGASQQGQASSGAPNKPSEGV